MAREKKIGAPVTLFATIEKDQYEFLRTVAFRERRSLADVVREAIRAFMQQQRKKRAGGRLIRASQVKKQAVSA